jgi:cyanophycinase
LNEIKENETIPYHYLAIGGGMELSKTNPLVTLFIEKSGGRKGIITILPTASDFGQQVGILYLEAFRELCDDVEYFLIENRSDAENPTLLAHLEKSTGVFFTGGDQLKITSLLGGSSVMKFIRKAKEKKIFIAGTSAGASAMSETMIAWGPSDSMAKGTLQMSPGIGLIRRLVIDSHFVNRGRISRLFQLIAQHPGMLGVGLAEDTGILIDLSEEEPKFLVVGSRQVVLVDGRGISHTNIASVDENQPFSLLNVQVHILGPGYAYNCNTNQVIIPKVSPALKQESKASELPFKPKLTDY